MNKLFRLNQIDWFAMFFGVLCFVVISSVIGAAGTALYTNDTHGSVITDAVIILLASWITAAGDGGDARHIFWLGIMIFIGLHIIGAIGCSFLYLVV